VKKVVPDYPTRERHLYVTDILWDLRFSRKYIFISRYSETRRRGALGGTSYFSSSGWKIQLAVSPKNIKSINSYLPKNMASYSRWSKTFCFHISRLHDFFG